MPHIANIWEISLCMELAVHQLSLVMSLMVSYFVLSSSSRDVLDEMWIELNQFLRIFLPT